MDTPKRPTTPSREGGFTCDESYARPVADGVVAALTAVVGGTVLTQARGDSSTYGILGVGGFVSLEVISLVHGVHAVNVCHELEEQYGSPHDHAGGVARLPSSRAVSPAWRAANLPRAWRLMNAALAAARARDCGAAASSLAAATEADPQMRDEIVIQDEALDRCLQPASPPSLGSADGPAQFCFDANAASICLPTEEECQHALAVLAVHGTCGQRR